MVALILILSWLLDTDAQLLVLVAHDESILAKIILASQN